MRKALTLIALTLTLATGWWVAPPPLSTAAEQTAADKRALAAHYRAEAATMRAKAEEHEAMAGRFRELGVKQDWATHCRNIANYYRKLAEENEALAVELEKPTQ